jgi:PAS domain S-box-containing protein
MPPTEARAEDSRYRTLLDAMDEAYCTAEVLFDASGRAIDHRIVDANPAFERHTGVLNPVGRLASELVPGGEQRWNDLYGRVAVSRVPERMEEGSDVMRRWFDVSVTPIGEASDHQVAILFKDVSARHNAEDALRQRTLQFETLLNEAPLGVYLIDADFRLRAVNPAALPTFAGVTQLIGRDFDELMHLLWPPERADATVLRFRHTLATGESFVAPDDTAVRYDRGVAEYYAWQINRISLPEGGYGVVCYFRDIAAEVEARTRLADSEAQYRNVFEAAPIAVLTFDRHTIVQSCNALAVELLARQPVYGIERHVEALSLWEADGQLIPHSENPMLRVLVTGEQVRDRHVLIKRVDGSKLPVMLSIAVQKTATGIITGAIASFVDISARLKADEARLRTQQELLFVMDSMPQKIWTAAPDGRIEYLNPQWMEFTGLSGDEVRDWTQNDLIHPEDLPHTLAAWTHGFGTGTPIQVEHRFRQADGEYRWHISRCLPMRDADQSIVEWVGSSTDIHTQKQTANAMARAGEAMVDASIRKDEFLAMLAHELRNPLAPIRNALQILQITNGTPESVGIAAAIIDRQTAQMIRLVDELLDVSRISRGTIGLRCEPITLDAIIQQAVETSRPSIERAGQQLRVRLPERPVCLVGDAVRLVQVFGNLLNNASKFTESGGQIELHAERQDNEVVVTARDSGIGIPSDMLVSVFDMFTQVDHSLERSRGGLGIGLSLVQRLVELHHGTVIAFSAGPDEGSIFTVRLPVLAEVVPAEACTTEASIHDAGTGRRVLVVDDNEDSANSLVLYLQLTGHDARTAYNGLEAIEVAEAFRPELMLLDIGMPRLNGLAAARRIRATEWGKQIMLVALSGWGQDDDRRKSAAAGFDTHLVKPINHETLAVLLSGVRANVATL